MGADPIRRFYHRCGPGPVARPAAGALRLFRVVDTGRPWADPCF